MEFLNINSAHVIDRIIPKETLYKNATLTEKEKNFFINSVERIKLYYTLTPINSNIFSNFEDDCNYDEIIFIELKLKNLDYLNKILNIIHNSIPKPLVLIGSYNNSKIISVAIKKNNNNRIKIADIYTTPLIDDLEEIRKMSITNIRASTISETYKNYVYFVKSQMIKEFIDNSNLSSFEISRGKIDDLFQLKEQLEILTEQMKKEVHLNKRVALSIEISRIKNII